MTPEREIYIANRAKEVLENEAYLEAHDSIRQELIHQWENAPFRDSQGRESLWIMLKQLDKLRLTLEATMQGGKLAAANLAYQAKLKASEMPIEHYSDDE